MEDNSSPLNCPSTVTIRRNPHRKARTTSSNTTNTAVAAVKPPPPSKDLNNVPNFPLNEILSIDLQPQLQSQNPRIQPSKPSNSCYSSDSLNVFLRIRPLPIAPSKLKQMKSRKTPKNCVVVNDCHSVTVSPSACDSNRLKSEVYNGFSHVFSSESSQDEVYEKLMRPVVEEFLNGKSGLLAALGPSGSGKTHTVFGSAKEPGLVPRVLRHIFEPCRGNLFMTSRFFLSVFEIYSEKGKGEKLSDLSPEGSDVHMQQSVVKGLKEILVKDVAQAESLLAHAKSKRVTAMTNSNSQSSRSQCIISIRCAVDKVEGEIDSKRSEAVLTFVDLAGAEREKKTGNKGGRLLESNFINNTSMVFGLCLRSLLEHQRNPKKPLQKHFQSSLLTKYLRDYLEGRKRMSLILTVRSGEEDYFDTSSLLRQASPFMEIKFHDMEETSNLPQNKRHRQIIGNEHHKKAKLSCEDARDDIGMTCQDSENVPKGGNKRNFVSRVGENSLLKDNYTDSNIQRQYNVMTGFAKALWAVLKQYKERVKIMQNDINSLTESLGIEHAQNLVMEKEIFNLKSQLSCPKQDLGVSSCSMGGLNTGSKLSLEELTVSGKVVSAEIPEFADIRCKENEIIHAVGENCTPHHQGDLIGDLGVTQPEDPHECAISECKATDLSSEKDVIGDLGVMQPEDPHKCSISERKTTNLLWSKDVHTEVEAGGTVISEVGCPCTDSGGGPDGILDSKEESRSASINEGSQDHLELGSATFSKVYSGDFPSGPKSLLSVDQSVNPDATLMETPLGANMSSSQSYREQQSQMECQISHDTSKNDFREKIHRKECSEESTGDAANITKSPVMDLVVQVESCGCDTPKKRDKENVANCHRSNINSELETKEISHNKPLKSGRPKRRLMPASSLLLRDAGSIDVAEENVKLRGGGVGRKFVEDEHKRTKGNAHLLRLLKNHLPR